MQRDQPTEESRPEDFDARVTGIAALGEPVRRALYRYAVAQPEAVTRDDAAAGTGVARHTAKFHLDKLVDDGLLDVEFARPPGRRGPGAGRPAKRYRRSARELSVSLPERDYELAGRLLAQAVTEAERDGVPVADALTRAARRAGRALGDQVRQRVRGGKRNRSSSVRAATSEVLSGCGYEPRDDDQGVTLVNCPFHALAQDYTDLVCGMNLELMEGLADELDDAPFVPRLDPAPGRCCVRLQESAAAATGAARGGGSEK